MKKTLSLILALAAVLSAAGCSDGGNTAETTEATTTTAAETTTATENIETTISEQGTAPAETTAETKEGTEEATEEKQTTADGDIINYTGESIVDEKDFEVFEKYFYGSWVDESGAAPESPELYYSGNTFSLGFYTLNDIYCDDSCAYLVTTIMGETTVYMIDKQSPEIMYEYCETNHGGIPKNQPDFTYTKTPAEEKEYLGYFGILRLNYVDKIPVEALTGNTFVIDGGNWVNFGEKITVLEKNSDKITLKALCHPDGENPYIIGAADKPLESRDIIYTVSFDGTEWRIGDYRFADV